MNKTTNPGIGETILFSPQEFSLASIASHQNLQQMVELIKSISSRKKKVDVADIQVFISKHVLDDEVSESITSALLSADQDTASALWESFGVGLKNSILVPDYGVLNMDVIQKMEITGIVVRNAVLAKRGIVPPSQTPYAYVYGDTSAAAAAELVLALQQLQRSKPYGRVLIDEFFEEIDTRILYLFAMSESEAYANEDMDGGAYLQLAMEANDKIPEATPLMSWLQEYVPDVFQTLREAVLDMTWQENRSMFWKGWIRQNSPHVSEDYYDAPQTFSRKIIGTMDDESILDDLISRNEESDQD